MAASSSLPQFDSLLQNHQIFSSFPSPPHSALSPPLPTGLPAPPVSANSSNSTSASASCSRKVQVIYVLARRSGQIDHPHLLEVCIPPNEGLYLRDVKKRLAMMRGKRLPSTFAWSYKRSYKTGYVWQDLCDDDLVFPAHGCEYVLKGSEILSENDAESTENSNGAQSGSANENSKTTTTAKVQADRINPDNELSSVNLSASLQMNSMVETGTDAATQTEEELHPSSSSTVQQLLHQRQQNMRAKASMYINREIQDRMQNQAQAASAISGNPNEQATELNKVDITSPPSMSSLSTSPSPYNNVLLGSNRSSPVDGDGGGAIEHSHGSGGEATEQSHRGAGRCKTPGRTWAHARPIQEENDEMMMSQSGASATMNGSPKVDTPSKAKYSSNGNLQDSAAAEQQLLCGIGSGRSSGKSKSGALSLLQLMSCGSLDIKEHILPMSLYQLRSRGVPGSDHESADQRQLPEVFDYGAASENTQYGFKSWSTLGKAGEITTKNSEIVSDGYVSYDDGRLGATAAGNAEMAASASPASNHGKLAKETNAMTLAQSLRHAGSRAPKSSRFDSNGQQIPADVISLGRSSISDRSLNGSRELQDYAQNMQQTSDHAHFIKLKSGELVNISHRASPRMATNGRELSRSTELSRGNSNGNYSYNPVMVMSSSGRVESPMNNSAMGTTTSAPARPLGVMLKAASTEANTTGSVLKSTNQYIAASSPRAVAATPSPQAGAPLRGAGGRKHYSASGLVMLEEHGASPAPAYASSDHQHLQIIQTIDDDDDGEITDRDLKAALESNRIRLNNLRASSQLREITCLSGSASPLWRSHQLQYQNSVMSHQQQQQKQQLEDHHQQQQQQHQLHQQQQLYSNNGAIICNSKLSSRSGPAMDQFKYSPGSALVYDRSMAQLWEELLAAPAAAAAKKAGSVNGSCCNNNAKIEMGDIYNHHNIRRLQQQAVSSVLSSMDLERERTLQNAVDLSLPSVEHLITLHDCPQCGRKVKPEQMKSHMKNCSSNNNRSSNNNNNNNNNNNYHTNSNSNNNNNSKPSKLQEPNLCQRLFRASPTKI